MKEVNIHEFDPQIYPRKIWVAVSCPKEVLADLFDFDLNEFDDNYAAVTYRCMRVKPTVQGGVLILFKNKSMMTSQIISHESCHAAMAILDFIGAKIDFDNQEYFCYLVGYIAKCCQQVKDNKFDE